MYIKYSEGNFLFLGTYKFAARILNHNEKNNTNQNESMKHIRNLWKNIWI